MCRVSSPTLNCHFNSFTASAPFSYLISSSKNLLTSSSFSVREGSNSDSIELKRSEADEKFSLVISAVVCRVDSAAAKTWLTENILRSSLLPNLAFHAECFFRKNKSLENVLNFFPRTFWELRVINSFRLQRHGKWQIMCECLVFMYRLYAIQLNDEIKYALKVKLIIKLYWEGWNAITPPQLWRIAKVLLVSLCNLQMSY